MKFRGKLFKTTPRDAVKIPRPGGEVISIFFKAMPLGLEEAAQQRFPDPEPPVDYARDIRGRLIKDTETGQYVTRVVESEDYKEKKRIATRRQMMFMVCTALDDPDWEFETPTSEGPEYYDAIFEELKAAGFSAGDLMLMFKKIVELSNMSEEAVEAARDALIQGKPQA